MINKKKLLIFTLSLLTLSIFIIFYFASSPKDNQFAKKSSFLTSFKQKKPLTNSYFFSSSAPSSPLVAYQFSSVSIHSISNFIQEKLSHQFSLIQQTENSFSLDISLLLMNNALEGCNNSDLDKDPIDLPEEESVPEIETNENDTSYRSHCEALKVSTSPPITEFEIAETAFQEFDAQYNFSPYFILSNFIATKTGFTAFYSYANNQGYALIYDQNYFPLTINFDQTMKPTTLLFNGQYLPVENTVEIISLVSPDEILNQINQRQITPIFSQNYVPKPTDYFSISYLGLVYFYQNNQYLPYYQMSGKIVTSDNFPTGQVFTFTISATQ